MVTSVLMLLPLILPALFLSEYVYTWIPKKGILSDLSIQIYRFLHGEGYTMSQEEQVCLNNSPRVSDIEQCSASSGAVAKVMCRLPLCIRGSSLT